jgi:hypothetical protein
MVGTPPVAFAPGAFAHPYELMEARTVFDPARTYVGALRGRGIRDSWSLQLDVGDPDYLGPLFDFFSDELTVFCG